MEPAHLRLDVAISVSRAEAQHESVCPDIGPICAVRNEPPQRHETTLWILETRLLAEYGLLPNLALQGVLPIRLIDTRTVFTDLAGQPIVLDYENIHHRSETLLKAGDLQILLHSGLKLDAVSLGGRLGLSLPFGATVPDPYRLGEEGLSHEHLQFGTGTVDPILGADLSINFDVWALAGFANAQTPLYEGPRGYRAGSRLTIGAVASSGFGLESATFRAALSAYHETPERWHGFVPTDDGNQGRTDLFAGPGVTIPLGDDWSVSLDVRARLYGHAVNAQLDLPLIVELSFGTLVHLEEDAGEAHTESTSSEADVEDVVTEGEAAELVPVVGKWTIFDFWAPWCEACTGLDLRLRSLATRDPRIALRRVNIVDFDSPIALRELPNVSVLPRIRVVDPEGATVWEQSGTTDELVKRLEQNLGTDARTD